jgi:hypothetical protein
VAQGQQEQKIETRTVERIGGFTILATAVAALAVLVATSVYAQDKYSPKSPSGIAFSDFRGYEDRVVVSFTRTDEVLKVIVANPTMITEHKAGVPGNGQPFPYGSMVVKLQWKPKKSTEAPFVVDVPDVFTQAFVMEKDSKRFPEAGVFPESRLMTLRERCFVPFIPRPFVTPCDAISAERLTETMAGRTGINYPRTSRPKFPILYSEDEKFPIPGFKVLRWSPQDKVMVIGAGGTLHEALKSASLNKSTLKAVS